MRVHKSSRIYMRGSGGELYPYVYSGDLSQLRGGGIGSIFSSIYSNVIPIVKKALGFGAKALRSNLSRGIIKDVKKTAMKAGLNVVNDTLQGKNVVKSTKKEIKKAQSIMGKKIKQRTKNYINTAPPKNIKQQNQNLRKVNATSVGSFRSHQNASCKKKS